LKNLLHCLHLLERESAVVAVVVAAAATMSVASKATAITLSISFLHLSLLDLDQHYCCYYATSVGRSDGLSGIRGFIA
jgi:hypothetical protein